MTIPPSPHDTNAVEQRFRDAGVVPPADRAAGTYAVAARLLAALHWVRQPRSAAAEPAHVYSLVEKD
jgi:hypothetical protein